MPIENLMILTDEQLVLMAQEGSETAEEILIDKYKGLVRAKAKAYFIAGAEAEDVIQEGMIGLIKAIRNFDKSREASFKTFAGTCINNQIIKAIRKADRNKSIALNDALSLNDRVSGEADSLTIGDIVKASMINEPEETVIFEDTISRLIRFQDTAFSDMEKEVLIRKLRGQSYTEIARDMNKSPKTIDNATQRIRRKIIDFLEK